MIERSVKERQRGGYIPQKPYLLSIFQLLKILILRSWKGSIWVVFLISQRCRSSRCRCSLQHSSWLTSALCLTTSTIF